MHVCLVSSVKTSDTLPCIHLEATCSHVGVPHEYLEFTGHMMPPYYYTTLRALLLQKFRTIDSERSQAMNIISNSVSNIILRFCRRVYEILTSCGPHIQYLLCVDYNSNLMCYIIAMQWSRKMNLIGGYGSVLFPHHYICQNPSPLAPRSYMTELPIMLL